MFDVISSKLIKIVWSKCVVLILLILGVQNAVNCLRFPLLSTSPNDVKFYIFTNKSHVDAHNEISYGDEKSITACGYNPEKRLILMVHGALSNYKTASDVQVIKNAYLGADTPANLILVDYAKLTVSRLPYVLSPFSILLAFGSGLNTIVVGKRIADFIQFLIKANALQGPEQVHIIGFSLGAHMAGVAGRLVQERTKISVSRITGLDPSRQIHLRRFHLTQASAKFVDISFTSLAVKGNLASLLGLREGHVQFYINGGGRQPNCPNLAPFVEPFCSHATAPYYYAKSIVQKDIPACQCVNCRGNWLRRIMMLRSQQCPNPVVYGECVANTARGNYYVDLS